MKKTLVSLFIFLLCAIGASAQFEPSFNLSIGPYGVSANIGVNSYYAPPPPPRHHHKRPVRHTRAVPVFIVQPEYYYGEVYDYGYDYGNRHYYKNQEKYYKKVAKYYEKRYKKAKKHHKHHHHYDWDDDDWDDDD